MRVRSFQDMQAEYNPTNRGLDPGDLVERKKLSDRYKFSVIVEGEYSEHENLTKWIKQNINENGIENIWYGKTGYDFGFAEYFVANQESEEKLKLVVPNIFTVYPSGKICKTDGCDILLDYDSSNKDSITFSHGR